MAYLLHAIRADLLRRLEREADAANAYESAISLAPNRVEQQLLERKLEELTRG